MTMTPKYEKPIHPMTLFVGTKTFTIVQKSLAKEDLYGCVEMHKALITVDPNQSLEDYKSTLLHEIFHVGFELFGLGHDDDIPTMGNEFLTTASSNMVMMFAGLNPKLFQYIFSNDK